MELFPLLEAKCCMDYCSNTPRSSAMNIQQKLDPLEELLAKLHESDPAVCEEALEVIAGGAFTERKAADAVIDRYLRAQTEENFLREEDDLFAKALHGAGVAGTEALLERMTLYAQEQHSREGWERDMSALYVLASIFDFHRLLSPQQSESLAVLSIRLRETEGEEIRFTLRQYGPDLFKDSGRCNGWIAFEK